VARRGARPLVMNAHNRPHVVTMCDRDDVAFYPSKHVLLAHIHHRRRASKRGMNGTEQVAALHE
jgi:hypothetical protein